MATVIDVQAVLIVGGPMPYREALTARLDGRGYKVVDGVLTEVPGSTVAVFYCADESGWRDLEATDEAGLLGRVAVVTELDPALYRRAIAMGVGVVHHDTSTEIIAHVIESAGHGEALLPMSVARRLVSDVGDASGGADSQLDALELELLRGLVTGETVVAMAERFHFSERTIRRRLQSAYLKLGVDDRVAAIRVIERDGLFQA